MTTYFIFNRLKNRLIMSQLMEKKTFLIFSPLISPTLYKGFTGTSLTVKLFMFKDTNKSFGWPYLGYMSLQFIV